ncbi:MAG: aminotransferase class IV family protein [Bacteroidetes bacterium]|nr:aminotransferase class IV family protein [Bacteroidota bacterium]
MALFLFYDNTWQDTQTPLLTAASRGFRYGDGLFETMYATPDGIRLRDYHFQRLFSGMQLLQLQLPEMYDAAFLAAAIGTLCRKNNHPHARIRLTVFRADGNLFDDPATPAHCIIESQPLAGPAAQASPLATGIYPHARKAMDPFANLKSNNYLPSAMAALHARRQGWEDALLLNAAGRLCESAIANIFIFRNGRLHTPPLSEGCVAGTMRRFLLENLPALGQPVAETPISTDDLYNADEVFLTNALRLLRPVSRCGHREYNTGFGQSLFHLLGKKWEASVQPIG